MLGLPVFLCNLRWSFALYQCQAKLLPMWQVPDRSSSQASNFWNSYSPLITASSIKMDREQPTYAEFTRKIKFLKHDIHWFWYLNNVIITLPFSMVVGPCCLYGVFFMSLQFYICTCLNWPLPNLEFCL